MALGVLLLALALGPPEAQAAVGDLSFAGCLANDAAQGCIDLPNSPLGSSNIAISPDGRSVYTSASDPSNDGMISTFDRAADGSLTFRGCVGNNSSQGCAELPGSPLRGAWDIAVSADGRSVYVASGLSNSLARFERAPDGSLSYTGCLASTAVDGCTDVAGASTPMDSTRRLAVAPDGTALYMQGQGPSVGRLLRFSLDPQGVPTYVGCLAEDATQGCTGDATKPLLGQGGILATGGSVYLLAASLNSVNRYGRTPFAFAECLTNAAYSACSTAPNDLGLLQDGAASPDGSSLYAVGTAGAGTRGVLTRFALGAGGAISYGDCQADSEPGCLDLPNSPIGGSGAVAVSPDGASVYVAGSFADDVATFRRGVGGSLSYAGCLGNDVSQGCGIVAGGPLDGARDVAVSPDGRSVYLTASSSKSLVVFNREVPGGSVPPVAFSLDLNAKAKQRVDKLAVLATCSEACEIEIRAKGRAGGKFKSKPAEGSLAAGVPEKLKLKRKILRKVDDHRGKVTFVATATSVSGGSAEGSAKSKLKR